jgi:hypothetical protein
MPAAREEGFLAQSRKDAKASPWAGTSLFSFRLCVFALEMASQ